MNRLLLAIIALAGACLGVVQALFDSTQPGDPALSRFFNDPPAFAMVFFGLAGIGVAFARPPKATPPAPVAFAAGAACAFGCLALLRYALQGGPALLPFMAIAALGIGVHCSRSLVAHFASAT